MLASKALTSNHLPTKGRSHIEILISGAGIAGLTAAYWLTKAGYRVTIVERAAGVRATGQNVDVRGPGRDVLQLMGLEEAALAATTGEVGLRFVDGKSVLAQFPVRADGAGDGPTAELEILRGQLTQLLTDVVIDAVEFVYGQEITAVEQDTDGVTVTLSSGTRRRFDALIIAEGARSRSRSFVFDDVTLRELGMYTAFGTVPRESADDQWWYWYNAPGGRSVTIRPDNLGTTRVVLSFLASRPCLDGMGADELRHALAAVYDGAGWQAPRICHALLGADQLYVDYLTQIKAPSWRSGRVILCGDAAWCATPVSGVGTTLALVGGYVLAGEIASADTLAVAVEGYERHLRPMVNRAQRLPPGVPRVAHPRSVAGVSILRILLRLTGSRLVRRLVDRLPKRTRPPAPLPRYPALTT